MHIDAAPQGHIREALALLTAVAALGCAHTETTAPKESGATAATADPAPVDLPAAEEPPDRAQHMRTTFWLAVDARDALIDGDLAKAKRYATALAEYDYQGKLPESWRHWVKDMQRHAGDAAIAGSMQEAASSIAALGLACANCHWYAGQGPDQPRDPPLPWEDPPEELGARMFRHEVGADQMWMGLIDPSEEAWRNGTITLTRAPLVAPEAGHEPVGATDHEQVERVRTLARRARAARSHQERAEVYAELITTCADCHQRSVRSEP